MGHPVLAANAGNDRGGRDGGGESGVAAHRPGREGKPPLEEQAGHVRVLPTQLVADVEPVVDEGRASSHHARGRRQNSADSAEEVGRRTREDDVDRSPAAALGLRTAAFAPE